MIQHAACARTEPSAWTSGANFSSMRFNGFGAIDVGAGDHPRGGRHVHAEIGSVFYGRGDDDLAVHGSIVTFFQPAC
ncbi:MAG: hypothetical protein WDN76_02540 [Alphaproteobacteria bacterium]